MHTPRTALLAALAALAASLSLAASAAAAPGDAPRITALPPTNIGVAWFDDHSPQGAGARCDKGGRTTYVRRAYRDGGAA